MLSYRYCKCWKNCHNNELIIHGIYSWLLWWRNKGASQWPTCGSVQWKNVPVALVILFYSELFEHMSHACFGKLITTTGCAKKTWTTLVVHVFRTTNDTIIPFVWYKPFLQHPEHRLDSDLDRRDSHIRHYDIIQWRHRPCSDRGKVLLDKR